VELNLGYALRNEGKYPEIYIEAVIKSGGVLYQGTNP
jgi:hypothetical protein